MMTWSGRLYYIDIQRLVVSHQVSLCHDDLVWQAILYRHTKTCVCLIKSVCDMMTWSGRLYYIDIQRLVVSHQVSL